MRAGVFSRTAVAACALRAAHLAVDQPVIFADPHAAQLCGQRPLSKWLLKADATAPRALLCARGHIVSRAAFAEHCLEQAVANGQADRYLILGAGLDSFAWRRPDWAASLPVTEIDHPATQREKRQRVRALGDAGPWSGLPVAFGEQDLRAALASIPGVDASPSFVSWLGVTPYLPWPVVMQTLIDLAAVVQPGSWLVLDFAEDFRRASPWRRETWAAALMAATVAAGGERFHNHRQDRDSLCQAWRAAGWMPQQILNEGAVNARFFTATGSALRTIAGTGLVSLQRTGFGADQDHP